MRRFSIAIDAAIDICVICIVLLTLYHKGTSIDGTWAAVQTKHGSTVYNFNDDELTLWTFDSATSSLSKRSYTTNHKEVEEYVYFICYKNDVNEISINRQIYIKGFKLHPLLCIDMVQFGSFEIQGDTLIMTLLYCDKQKNIDSAPEEDLYRIRLSKYVIPTSP